MTDRNLISLCSDHSAANNISRASAHFNWINAIVKGAGMHSTGFEFGIAATQDTLSQICGIILN